MVDNKYEYLYYIVTGKLYKKQNKMMGVLSNEKMGNGDKKITEYRESSVQRIFLQLFGKA